tara:strand:+ start:14 stop:298 length:285 start_codon:yes stop_codon:yes gene_type:complete
MNEIVKAILAINPKAEVGIDSNDIDTCKIEWLNGTKEISKADIKAKMTAIAYIGKRQPEYPSIGDQLDALYHGGVFPKEMADLIKSVKDKYPKG